MPCEDVDPGLGGIRGITLRIPYRRRENFIYEYEKNVETLAMDFTLSAGDKFTTMNGIEWKVTEVKDTLVEYSSYSIRPQELERRLLKVESVDGRFTDQWLEDFGSFSNHFMIRNMTDDVLSIVPWMQVAFSWYVVREFSCDPIFGHATRYKEPAPNDETVGIPSTHVSFEDGVFSFYQNYYDLLAFSYNLFHRQGDSINLLNYWSFDYSMQNVWYSEKIIFTGLPEPESGGYTLCFPNAKYSTSLKQVKPSAVDVHPVPIFDLQGRRLQAVPERGMFIQDGRVKVK